ncbi:MAG: 5-oxoprolinase subunit PxpB [Bryobacteraceae bacterium]
MDIRQASDASLLVYLPDHREVWRMMRALQGMGGVRNLHPAYASVLVDFDPRLREAGELRRQIEALPLASVELPEPRLIEIPVRYGGWDLDDVARHNGLSTDEVIAIHSGAEYVVYFLGFSPGFPYLGGMPEAIATPRLAAPRRMVPAGSVGIAGTQTGVYPVASPGGWRIIGRTGLALFDALRDPPALLAAGDRVRFRPV